LNGFEQEALMPDAAILRREITDPKEAIRELRRSRGWTQENLAEILQVSPRTIFAYERQAMEIPMQIFSKLAFLCTRHPIMPNLQAVFNHEINQFVTPEWRLHSENLTKQILDRQPLDSLDDPRPSTGQIPGMTDEITRDLLRELWKDWKACTPPTDAREKRLRAHMERNLLQLADELLADGRKELEADGES
jgi:transcriptional regulator with XRE-family HTH domain